MPCLYSVVMNRPQMHSQGATVVLQHSKEITRAAEHSLNAMTRAPESDGFSAASRTHHNALTEYSTHSQPYGRSVGPRTTQRDFPACTDMRALHLSCLTHTVDQRQHVQYRSDYDHTVPT